MGQTALLVIDVQMDFADRNAAGRGYGNPDPNTRIADLLAGFRASGLPVIHVHHHGTDPQDTFHPSHPGSAVQPFAAPLAGELVYLKHGSSAFIGTALEADLRSAGLTGLVIAGGAANFCVESSARMAGDLGFATTVVGDALINFGQTGPDGRKFVARDVLELTLANLSGEFARVLTTDQVLAEIGAAPVLPG